VEQLDWTHKLNIESNGVDKVITLLISREIVAFSLDLNVIPRSWTGESLTQNAGSYTLEGGRECGDRDFESDSPPTRSGFFHQQPTADPKFPRTCG
jgi:hypothetical protein